MKTISMYLLFFLVAIIFGLLPDRLYGQYMTVKTLIYNSEYRGNNWDDVANSDPILKLTDRDITEFELELKVPHGATTLMSANLWKDLLFIVQCNQVMDKIYVSVLDEHRRFKKTFTIPSGSGYSFNEEFFSPVCIDAEGDIYIVTAKRGDISPLKSLSKYDQAGKQLWTRENPIAFGEINVEHLRQLDRGVMGISKVMADADAEKVLAYFNETPKIDSFVEFSGKRTVTDAVGFIEKVGPLRTFQDKNLTVFPDGRCYYVDCISSEDKATDVFKLTDVRGDHTLFLDPKTNGIVKRSFFPLVDSDGNTIISYRTKERKKLASDNKKRTYHSNIIAVFDAKGELIKEDYVFQDERKLLPILKPLYVQDNKMVSKQGSKIRYSSYDLSELYSYKNLNVRSDVEDEPSQILKAEQAVKKRLLYRLEPNTYILIGLY